MLRTTHRELVRDGSLPAVRPVGERVTALVREVGRDAIFAELAAHESALLQDAVMGRVDVSSLEAFLDGSGSLAAALAQASVAVGAPTATDHPHRPPMNLAARVARLVSSWSDTGGPEQRPPLPSSAPSFRCRSRYAPPPTRPVGTTSSR